jgi:transcriptional regulator with XRE-family HTH domain
MGISERRYSIAAEVRAAIARAGLRQTAVADAVGMSRTAMGYRLKGRYPFTIDELYAISSYLGVPIGTLIPPISHAPVTGQMA